MCSKSSPPPWSQDFGTKNLRTPSCWTKNGGVEVDNGVCLQNVVFFVKADFFCYLRSCLPTQVVYRYLFLILFAHCLVLTFFFTDLLCKTPKKSVKRYNREADWKAYLQTQHIKFESVTAGGKILPAKNNYHKVPQASNKGMVGLS